MAENMTPQEKKEALRIKFVEIKQAIHASKEEAKTHVEGQAKAQWAITLCTRRAEENDGCINDEIARKADLKRELDATKDELSELHMEVEVTKSKLNSILELQRELSNKMQLSSLARSRAECCRDQSSHRWIFVSDHMRLKSGGDWTNVSKAKLHRISVAIKLYSSADVDSKDTFNAKILTGRIWAGIVEEAIMMDHTKLIAVLDPLAGEWQLDVALELGRIGIKCLSVHEDKELNMTNLARELEKVKKLADEIVANGECVVANGRHVDDKEDSAEFPNFFLFPIFQNVLRVAII
ncbi:hypothetical protein K7X08_003123 [Anisodus acutangulus]|uniref:RING-type E3 ubiquitin transferase n=1 Tax=Anisodus acutangulus TaxID=402998 RepID=A0A9Q1MDG6_9SOLA|nr:hypothetical protein K7X08_003123 [Anisodus acutangulus]